MITVKTIVCNPVQENCFVVSDETREAAVIDCGALYDHERKATVNYLKDNGLTLRHVLCTHAHFDHIFGLDTLFDEFGVKPRLHPADRPLYEGMNQQVAAFFGSGYDRPLPPLGDDLCDGELITLGTHTLQVLHTPGHSPGSVVFYCESEKKLFSGDTLFRMSVGRTDLQGGSWQQLMHSLQHVLAPLPADVTVYSGHGPNTMMGDEVQMNPYFTSL
ncbi:MAG: MBL fold metallo-hydrolase [Prevotella sp.]|nr:MBL fold metallo-hydrolase [Prevotella sp.]